MAYFCLSHIASLSSINVSRKEVNHIWYATRRALRVLTRNFSLAGRSAELPEQAGDASRETRSVGLVSARQNSGQTPSELTKDLLKTIKHFNTLQ